MADKSDSEVERKKVCDKINILTFYSKWLRFEAEAAVAGQEVDREEEVEEGGVEGAGEVEGAVAATSSIAVESALEAATKGLTARE